jgi:hypothetical protein
MSSFFDSESIESNLWQSSTIIINQRIFRLWTSLEKLFCCQELDCYAVQWWNTNIIMFRKTPNVSSEDERVDSNQWQSKKSAFPPWNNMVLYIWLCNIADGALLSIKKWYLPYMCSPTCEGCETWDIQRTFSGRYGPHHSELGLWMTLLSYRYYVTLLLLSVLFCSMWPIKNTKQHP